MRLHLLQRGCALALLLSGLAGCAQPPADKFAATQSAFPGTASAPAITLRAFTAICGQLNAEEVLRRAAAHGFAQIPSDRLPSGILDALPDRSVRILTRPPGTAPALLFWSDRLRTCELVAWDVDPAAVGAAFDGMIGRLSASPEMSVTDLPLRSDGTESPPLRRAVMVSVKALVPFTPRVLRLRLEDRPGKRQQVSLAAAALTGQPGATPPPSQGMLKW